MFIVEQLNVLFSCSQRYILFREQNNQIIKKQLLLGNFSRELFVVVLLLDLFCWFCCKFATLAVGSVFWSIHAL